MPDSTWGEATRLLQAVRQGDTQSSEELMQLLYREIHGLARHHAQPGRTLQPTALVNEVWLKMHGKLGSIDDRRHFLLVASRAMRQILANHARDARALKRGGGNVGVTLDTGLGVIDNELDVVALDDTLDKLAQLNPRHARVVELRFLCSLTIEETADVLEVSHSTVESDWSMARAWLRRELRDG